MIANALIVIGLVSLGAIIGVFVAAMACAAGKADNEHDTVQMIRTEFERGRKVGYVDGWRAALRASKHGRKRDGAA